MDQTSSGPSKRDVDIVTKSRCFDGKHSQQMNKTLNRFRLTDSKYCDVVLEADGQTFPAHKCVLASMSDFFDKMFTVEFQEKYKDSIKITQVSATTLKLVLDYIYTSKVTLDEENAFDVLAASDYFMLQSLKQFSCVFLFEIQSPENCLKIWQYAKKYNSHRLEKQSGRFIANHFLEITAVESFLQLEFETFQQVVLLKDANESIEENVYGLIAAWVCHEKETRNKDFPQLFFLLNLQKISKVFFSKVVLKKGLVMEHDDLYRTVVKTICSEIVDEHWKRSEMELCIQPSTSMLVVTSKGTLRKFDIRNNYQEPVCLKEFDSYDAAVKMQNCIYLLGCEHGDKVVNFNLKSPEKGWQDVTSLPEEAHVSCATVVDDSFIVASSRNGTYIFDGTTTQWKKTTENKFAFESCLFPRKGEVVGMQSDCSYNVCNKTWTSSETSVKQAMKGIVCGHLVLTFSQTISSARRSNRSDMDCCMLQNGQSLFLSEMSSVRSVTDACLVDGKIVVVVESVTEGTLLKEYDPINSRWRVITGVNDGDFKSIFSLNC